MTRRWALTVVVAVLFLLLPTGGASADDGPGPDFLYPDCTTEPVADGPDIGAANELDPGPKRPGTGDPFKKGSDTSIYDAYGYAGLDWISVRPSCDPGPDVVYDSGGVAAETIANTALGGLSTATAVVNRVDRLVYDTPYLDTLQPALDTSRDVFGLRIFMPLAGIVMAGVGLMVMVRAHSGDVADSMRKGQWAVGVVAITLAMLTWPTVIAPKAVGVVTGSINYVQQAINEKTGAPGSTLADSAAGNIHYALLYQTWCAGNVGAGNSAAAHEFCPKLWKAGTFSRSELAKLKPDEVGDAQKKKASEFENTAQDLKKKYPAAYEYLAGNKNTDRVQAAVVGWVAFLLTLPFTLFAALLFGFAVLCVVAGLFIFPLVALLAIYYPWRAPLLGIVSRAFTQARNAVIFGAVSAVMLASFAGFLGPDSSITPLWACLLMAVFAAAVWHQTKGFRTLAGRPDWLKRKFPTRPAGQFAPADGYDYDYWGDSSSGDGDRSAPAETRPMDTGVRSPTPHDTRDAVIRGAVTAGVAAAASGGAAWAATTAAAAKTVVAEKVPVWASAVTTPVYRTTNTAAAAPGTAQVSPGRVITRTPPPQELRAVEPTKTSDGEVVYPIYTPGGVR